MSWTTLLSSPKLRKGTNYFVHVMLQAMFAFIFLTVFYFSFAVRMEKKEFQDQIQYLTKDLIDSSKNEIISTLSKNAKSQDKYNIITVVDGLLDSTGQKIIDTATQANETISKNNRKVMSKSFDVLAITCTPILVLITILVISGLVDDPFNHFKSACISVFFIALTEFSFLMLVTTKFIAADPTQVKTKIGNKIIEWIKSNK